MFSVDSLFPAYSDNGRRQDVIAVIKNRENEYLLVTKHFYPKGAYRFPGGGIEKGETPEQAVVREALEEFNQQMAVEKNLGSSSFPLHDKNGDFIFVSYLFLLSSEHEIDLAKDREHSGYKWVKLEELPLYAQKLRELQGEWRGWGQFRSKALEDVYNRLRAD